MEQGKASNEIPVIDLEKVIASKNPKLVKYMPGFILNYIKKTLHQDDMNGFLQRNYKYQGLDFLNKILEEFKIRVETKGIENVPLEGGCILSGNHPLGGMDGIALMAVVGNHRKKKDIKFIVNDILLNLKNLADLFVPVNKHGRNSSEVIARIDETYASDNAVLIFPAGLVSRKQSGKVKDLEWKKSFIVQAKKHKKDIIPFYVQGNNTSFFYNFALARKKVGIKANIEMFFLVDEMYKQQNKTITIIFGKPVSYKTFDDSKSDSEWAAIMKEHVYALGKGQPSPLKAQ